MTSSESIRGGILGGTFAGLEIGFAGALLGPAALGIGIAQPATWGFYAAAAGAPIAAAQFGYLTHTESPEEATHPQSLNTFIRSHTLRLGEALNSRNPLLGNMLQQLGESPGGRVTLAAASGAVLGAIGLGSQAYLAGGLASVAAHIAATVAASV